MKADNDCTDSFGETSAENLRAEIYRLREDNDDLRASALMWKELYEAAAGPASDSAVGSTTPGQGRRPAIPVDFSVNMNGNGEQSRTEKPPSRVGHVAF
jgi:hypothetical protein